MGPNDSQWLFRQGDLILGPAPSSQIVEKLYSGELAPSSEVQLVGTSGFQRLADVAEFKVHVAKAEAKRRVDAHAAEHHATQRQRLVRNAAIVGGVLLALGVGVAGLGSYLAVHAPSAASADEEAWGEITIINKASRHDDDELVDYQGGTKPRGGAQGSRTAPAPRLGSADPDGLQVGAVDEAGINAVVAKNKPSLLPCLKAVAKPGMVAKVPIEFSIAETGKVTKVWVDNADFKGSGLQECLLEKLQAWPFKPGTSGATVNLSFNIGKRG